MSLKLGNTPISGISQNTKYNAHHLLDFKWTDCIMNDVSWLRADTFSWQSGDVYVSAYNHLVADLQGATSETETIGSYTITFYRATDGHKITTDESTAADIYNETGVAWYYVLDTTNTRFKLPRSTYNAYSKKLPVKGNGMTLGFDNGTNTFGLSTYYDHFDDNAFPNLYGTNVGTAPTGSVISSVNKSLGITTDGTKSGIIAQSETLDNMYLYFYVGDYSQTAIEQTAGLNSELFNGKADINLSNINPSKSAKETIISWGMPDYTAGVSIASGNSAATDGLISISAGAPGGSSQYSAIITIGNQTFSWYLSSVNVFQPVYPIVKGETISWSGSAGISATFYPMKGVN